MKANGGAKGKNFSFGSRAGAASAQSGPGRGAEAVRSRRRSRMKARMAARGVGLEVMRRRGSRGGSEAAMGEAALIEVLLVVLLGAPELAGRDDFGDDGALQASVGFLAVLGGAGGGFLLR